MRIAHFAPDLWAHGGLSTYVRRLGAGQTGRGHDIWYVNLDEYDDGTDRGPQHVSVCSEEEVLALTETLQIDVLHLHRVLESLPETDIAVVRTIHGNEGSCPSGTRFLSRTETACDRTYSPLGCLWGHYVDRCGNRRPKRVIGAYRQITRERTQAAHLPTITVSRFLRDRMLESGCPADTLHAVPSPAPVVRETPTTPPPESTRFLFLGRIVPQKGVAWLLRALRQTDPTITVDVAGDGYTFDAVKELARRYGVDHRVTFHGWVPPEKVAALIQSSRAVVVPSIWHEPAGLVTLEAAAHGRPVIASRVGGLPEYALPSYSLLVDPNDTDGLANAMTTLATDVALATEMGAAGRRAMQSQFDMPTFLDRNQAVYESALEQNATSFSEPAPAAAL